MSLFSHKLERILIPLTENDIWSLNCLFFTWWAYSNPNDSPKPINSLMLTLPRYTLPTTDYMINRAIKSFKIEKLFDSTAVTFLGIDKEKDIYIRHADQLDNIDNLPPLGMKSGPNEQFFRSMRYSSAFDTTLLHETDMTPISATWLADIVELVEKTENFWVLGSSYKGFNRLGADISRHINGNAFYATGHEDFIEYTAKTWRPCLETMCKERPDTAYDIWLSRYYHDNALTGFSNLSEQEYQHLGRIQDFHRNTSMIHSCCIESDSISIKHLQELNNTGARLVHSKNAIPASICMAIYHTIETKDLDEAKEPLLILLSAIKQSPLDEAYKRHLLSIIKDCILSRVESAKQSLDELYAYEF